MKYKQTVMMGISLVLMIAFFMPWFSMNSENDMFAASDARYSGFGLVRGIHAAAPTISSLGELYGFPVISKLIYIGYLLLLIPILGFVAIIMSGLRMDKSKLVHLGQYGLAFMILLLFALVINVNGDMRTLFQSFFNTSIGLWVSLLASMLGLGTVFFK